jgi:hypothetical protein
VRNKMKSSLLVPVLVALLATPALAAPKDKPPKPTPSNIGLTAGYDCVDPDLCIAVFPNGDVYSISLPNNYQKVSNVLLAGEKPRSFTIRCTSTRVIDRPCSGVDSEGHFYWGSVPGDVNAFQRRF